MPRERVRPEILSFTPYVPGLSEQEIMERYGLSRVIKLASNENPLGVSPLAEKAIARAADRAYRYPWNHTPHLVAAIARTFGVPEERVIAGNGSDEVIDLLMRVVARPGRDNVVCYEHCFSMYGLTARLSGVAYREVPRGEDFRLPLAALAEAADGNTALVIVTTPDNPTGVTADVEGLRRLAGALPEGTLLVVDEAYMDFASPQQSMLQDAAGADNIVVLRTFSKAYGLAGLRLGFGVLPAWLAEHVRRARAPFTVNLLAEEAGLAALEDKKFYAATLAAVSAGRELFQKRLPELGCRVWPSQSNFVMFRPPMDAGRVAGELLRRGIIVRHLKSFGLPENIRVNVGSVEENGIFLAALEDIFHHG